MEGEGARVGVSEGGRVHVGGSEGGRGWRESHPRPGWSCRSRCADPDSSQDRSPCARPTRESGCLDYSQ